jgi:hypothetical protein
MSGDVYQFSGPDASLTMDMICDLARFVDGPGLPGFVAWLERGGCSANPAYVRANLQSLVMQIRRVS